MGGEGKPSPLLMPIIGDISQESNTPLEVQEAHAAINVARNVRRFATQPTREGNVCIVGGGPSLADTIEELRWRQSIGQLVWATNATFSYLMERGIMPDAHVILDSRPENLAFLRPTQGVTYYVNIRCHPSLFDALAGHDVVMYDFASAGTGTTVGLKALYLAGFSGFRNFHLYGMDSSYRGAENHAYPQPLNDGENIVEVTAEGKKFKCAAWMLTQAEEFQQIAASFAEQGCTITVAGDGLLPLIAHRLSNPDRILTCVWDLQVCPPTYDITSFLGECEFRREEIGAKYIDIVIQPGPIDGFRDDDLPPSLGNREGMLYRVAVAMCRLLPSVRNIDIRRARGPVVGTDIFPPDYELNDPQRHYGPSFLYRARPVLRATTAARAFVERTVTTRPYVTITIREASHWPTRNSNIAAWRNVREWLEKNGYAVVWVPDTESADANAFSWDLDLRLALYEGAALNLGINNGPTFMWLYCDVAFIIFKCVTEGIYWTSEEFFDRFGIKPGSIGERGRLVFAQDDYETIIKELTAFFKIAKEAA